MEYNKFAKFYDKLYSKKDYNKEVEFIKNFIKEDDYILDVGCGTGVHASLLENDGYLVDGMDISKDMLDIARAKLKGGLYNQNVLDININKKYDVVISMFAVMNHLKNIKELEKALFNIKKILKDNGIIILDLHNPKSSGSKTDSIDNIKRTMIWNYDEIEKLEETEIIFEIDNVKYFDKHTFKIFSIDGIRATAKNVGLNVINVYEDYDVNKIGNNNSKNLQFIIC